MARQEASTPRIERHDSTDATLRADRALPTEAKEPTDRTDPAEPIEPTESTEPMDPMDRTEPTESIDSTEPFDRMDRTEPFTGAEASPFRRPAIGLRRAAEPARVERLHTRLRQARLAAPDSAAAREAELAAQIYQRRFAAAYA